MGKIYPEDIATEIEQPDFTNLIQQFIYNQEHSNGNSASSLAAPPIFYREITIYPSAVAMFHALSNISGIGGMCCEHIHAVKLWRKGPQHHDTIFVNTNPSTEGMHGLDVAHALLFFLFSHNGIKYLCALVHRFSCTSDPPNNNTRMWEVEPDLGNNGIKHVSIIHLDTIVQAAHFLPIFG